MDKEKTKDLIKVMQAFLEGEAIECKIRESEDLPSNWFTHDVDYWNTDTYMYRIKPKPQYRPFKDREECWNEMKNHQPFGWVKMDGNYENIVEVNTKEEMFVNSGFYNWPYTCENITFADGTPFGMKVTDNCSMLRKAPKKAPK